MVSRGRPSRLNQQVRIVSRWSRKTLLWGRARGRARARARGPELGLGCCRHTLVLEARAMQQTAATCVEGKPAQAPSGGCFQRQSTQAVPASVGPIRRLRPRWPAVHTGLGFDTACDEQRRRQLSIHTLEQGRAVELQAQVRRRRVGGDDGVLHARRRRVSRGPRWPAARGRGGGARDRAGSLERAAARAQVREAAAAALRVRAASGIHRLLGIATNLQSSLVLP